MRLLDDVDMPPSDFGEAELERLRDAACAADGDVVDMFMSHLCHPFAPLLSVIGGFAAQECIKSLTGQFQLGS